MALTPPPSSSSHFYIYPHIVTRGEKKQTPPLSTAAGTFKPESRHSAPAALTGEVLTAALVHQPFRVGQLVRRVNQLEI